jgi:hypothetical protein
MMLEDFMRYLIVLGEARFHAGCRGATDPTLITTAGWLVSRTTGRRSVCRIGENVCTLALIEHLGKEGDPAGAEQKLVNANTRGPHWADPLKAWGDVLLKRGHGKEALAKYYEALKQAPSWKQLKEAREAVAKQKSNWPAGKRTIAAVGYRFSTDVMVDSPANGLRQAAAGRGCVITRARSGG